MIKLTRILFLRLIMPVAGVLFCIPSSFANPAYTATPDNYLARLRALEPGGNLLLMPGEYKDGLPVRHLCGTAQAPIVIRGPDSEPRAVFVARPGHNTVSILNSSYVTIRDLDLDGRNLPVDGVKCEGHADWAHHITLDGLRIWGHGNNQHIAGISTKCPAWGWVIRNNVIERAGTGLYLGNSDGRAPFIAGLIEHNLIVGTIGYNVQIKHQQPRPALPEMPPDGSATIVRHNVFSKASAGSRKMARPNMLVGHWPLTGPGANDRHLVYGNLFHQNLHESLFQGEGNIALYNNLLVNHSGDAVRIQPHNGSPGRISIFNNTVIAKKSGITILRRRLVAADRLVVTANIVFAQAAMRGAPPEGNLTGTLGEARDFLARPFAPLGEMNLMPAVKVRKHAADVPFFHAYPESGLDFDGDLHGASRLGAYALDKQRPNRLPELAIKPLAGKK